MDELLELIARIGTDDPPTEEELTKARADLVALLKVATAKETRDLESAVALREAVDKIDAEGERRKEETARVDAEAKKLLEGLNEPEPEEPAKGDDPESAPEGDPAPEGEPADKPAERQPQPVAASSGLRNALRSTRARMQSDNPPEGPSHARIVTLGAAQSEPLTPGATLTDVARVFTRTAGRVRNLGDRQSLVRVEYDYPNDRKLFASEKQDNDALIDRFMAPQAIAAAGGICDPLPADFTHPALGVRGRPIRDALPRFQAARGGVRYSQTATLADVADGVGVWTIETDTSPGETVKACLVVDCDEEQTALVDAVTACLQIGNFQARFNPEYWRSRLDLLMVAHDRLAEQTLYADMDAAATQVTYGAGSGSIYAILSGIDKAVAGMRSRLRLGRGTVIRAVAPEWTLNALRSDIASQRIGGNPAEALNLADQVIASFFSSRGITPVWSPDLDLFGTQGAGALLDWPGGDVEILLYPEGTFFYLDGGTLDLGTEVIDSTLIRTNDRIAFLETFEKVAFRGGQALALTVPVAELCVCPDVVSTSP